ncbi:integumentary mucin C.1-like isoform X2 [Biomphalaria glabrata]|uniref:Integumentary mucin C.1-like isoform X2 n=1 Tax=Biomphalaria glabrata TaxID=6526 RepID=A0A9W3BDR5_BIOGL|nr:integumentary mucin C.1-like isoform X2 [Biomphalaria glabrata]
MSVYVYKMLKNVVIWFVLAVASLKSVLAVCVDKEGCENYDREACSVIKYGDWGIKNCPVFCGLCGGLTTSSTTPPPCVDLEPDCESYQDDTCTNPSYKHWAESHCRKFCKLCDDGSTSVITTTTTTPRPCIDVEPDCASYQSDVCTSPTYRHWVDENCRKFCKFCVDNTTMIDVTTSTPATTTTKSTSTTTATTSTTPTRSRTTTTAQITGAQSTTIKTPPPLPFKTPPPLIRTPPPLLVGKK